MEFGKPHLEVSEPPARPGRRRRRVVALCGDWHLWIYCCHWFVFQDGQRVGDSEGSEAKIKRAVRVLDGQRLVGVTINQLPGRSVFTFDLGGALHTRPYSQRSSDSSLEQWLLYEPGRTVLTLNSDGRYSREWDEAAPRECDSWVAPVSLTIAT